MQQAIYNTRSANTLTLVDTTRTANTATATARVTTGTGLLRWMGRKWDLIGIVGLLGSSAAYGMCALKHLA